ncbi:hypothetical protein [Methanobrevibacter sp.]|uniref:hypothetical protein n=1 Tax=Methanobrevibacter sp. TaxID=66852 RepID=UPI00388D58FC
MNKKAILLLIICLSAICLINIASAHEVEYPDVKIDTPKINSEVSGTVDFNMSIEDHHETLYVNVTARHLETDTVYYSGQDNNSNDGWSCSWDTSDSPNGKYHVSAVAINSKNLQGLYEILITLNNTKQKSNIVLDSSIGVVNKENTIVAYLNDVASKPISNKNLEFDIDGKTYSTTTMSDGAAVVSFTPKEIKNYTVNVKFEGDSNYLASQNTMVFNVLANASMITINNITADNKEKIILNANLKNQNTVLAAKEVDFYINGNKIGHAVSDENGDAKMEYDVSEVGGKYLISAEYDDSASNQLIKGFSTLYVPESSLFTRITATTFSKDGIFTVGNTFKVTYTIFNNGPDIAENVVFTYNVPDSLEFISYLQSQGNAAFNEKTNEFIWEIGDVSLGNQSLEILFKTTKAAKNNLAPVISTSTYDQSVNNNITRNILSVKEYKLVADDLTKYYTGSQKYKVFVKDEDGNVIQGAIVNLFYKNKAIASVKTNENGFVQLDIKDVGKYTIKATCADMSISNKVIVKPLIVTKDISKKKSKKIKFTAKLVNNKGKAVANKKLTFKFNGKKFTAKTNKKGVATLTLKNLKVGKYKIQTSYGKSSVKNKIVIKK